MRETLGVYVHFPYCLRRCPYCAFFSTEGGSDDDYHAYTRQILKEFELRSQDWRDCSLGSIYFGGGTPSLMSAQDVRQILETITGIITPATGIEITLEANPGTLDATVLVQMQRAGVNRISLGIQALDDERLEFLGRIHDRSQALEAVKAVKAIPGIALSVDLMAGTPYETAEGWDRELDDLFASEPDAVSFYSLTIEEGTELARREHLGEPVYLTADATVDLLLHAAGRLQEAGYRHYEVSNWAKPGFESRHNRHYWQRGAYLGLGPSAHSFDGKMRTWNLPDLTGYAQALDLERQPPTESEELTREETRTEWIYLKLRQTEGIRFEDYGREFGEVPHYWKVMFEKIAVRGLGEFDGEHFKPNDHGLLLADEIAGRILG